MRRTTRRLYAMRAAIVPALFLAAQLLSAQPNMLQKPLDNSAQIVSKVGIDQRLNAQVPLSLRFRDESGRDVRLSDYVKDRPVVLILAYYRCPMLCTEVLNGALKAMRTLDFDLGKEYVALTVSIDPRETPQLATEKKSSYITSYKRAGAADGWHFLVGPQESIDTLARAVGFRYVYDGGSDQFAHAGGMMILTPQGRISRYFYGVEFSPNDLKFGLMDASDNKIGSLVERTVLLLCFHYDPTTGKYGFMVMSVLRIGGAITILGFLTFWYRAWRRERAKRDAGTAAPTAA